MKLDKESFDRAMKALVTVAMLIGFFAVLAFMLSIKADAQLVGMMIGALVGALGQSVSFQFGTTATEAARAARNAPQPPPVVTQQPETK